MGGKVAQLFGSGFRNSDFRPQLINVLGLRDGQCVLLCFIDASVFLIEVEDVRREERRFLINVGEGFLHKLLNEPPQLTGRTPNIAPNMVLALVILTRLGFSGLRMNKVNSITLRFLGFR